MGARVGEAGSVDACVQSDGPQAASKVRAGDSKRLEKRFDRGGSPRSLTGCIAVSEVTESPQRCSSACSACHSLSRTWCCRDRYRPSSAPFFSSSFSFLPLTRFCFFFPRVPLVLYRIPCSHLRLLYTPPLLFSPSPPLLPHNHFPPLDRHGRPPSSPP